MKSFNPNAPRDITQEIGVSRNTVEVTQPRNGCWRVEVNGKPVADWCNQQDAERDATRRGWTGNGKPQGKQASMFNSFANEIQPGIFLALGPTRKLAFVRG